MERQRDTENRKDATAQDATRPCPECSMGPSRPECPLCHGSGWVTPLVLRIYLEQVGGEYRAA